MPRAFSESERAAIREALLARGAELLASYGIRRSNVEDLTAAAGISKGAFYLFFESKEELFYAVLRRFEAAYHAELLGALGPPEQPPRARLRAFVERAMTAWRSSPLFTRFGRDDYELLARRLPPALLAEGLQDDVAFAGRLIERWAAEGLTVRADAELLAGLMRALFYVTLHADEFAPALYAATIDRLVGAVVADLVEQ